MGIPVVRVACGCSFYCSVHESAPERVWYLPVLRASTSRQVGVSASPNLMCSAGPPMVRLARLFLAAGVF